MNIPSMTHRAAANAQIGLSYFYLTGYFAVLVLYGLGILKVNVIEDLTPLTAMVLTFWFQRQRTSADTNPTQPESPAGAQK